MQLAAISFERHGQQALRKNDARYLFASQETLIPVVAAELSHLLPSMALTFVPKEQSYLLMALTSLQPNHNLYVAPNTGKWLAEYIPASLRAWPYHMATPPGADAPILCIDEDCGLLAPKGEGSDFFEAPGKLTEATQKMLSFLSHIETNRRLTQDAVDALGAAGLIQPWALQAKKDDATVPINGLFRINEQALNALDANQLHELHGKGALAIAYAQLYSIQQLSMLEKLAGAHAQLRQKAASATVDAGFLKDRETIDFGGLK